jgi:hypothetical protein
MKSTTIQSPDEILVRKTKNPTVVRTYLRITKDKVETLDTMYVNYVNDTLKEVRKGKVGYAYHVYQIREMLKLEIGLNATGY